MMKSIWNMVVRYFRQTDKVIWGLCLTASAMSVVLLLGIWNSGYVNLSRPIVQCIAIGLGCGAMFLLSRVDYQTMADLWRLHVPLTYGLVLLTFILVFAWKKIVSLASICAAVMYPVFTFLFLFFVEFSGSPLAHHGDKSLGYLLFATAAALFAGVTVVLKHSANIGRLRRGEEKPITLGKSK